MWMGFLPMAERTELTLFVPYTCCLRYDYGVLFPPSFSQDSFLDKLSSLCQEPHLPS